MFFIADIIVVAIIALAAFIGYKKGFIKTGFCIVSFFVAIALTFMFYQPVMEIIKENTGFEEWLTGYLNQLEWKNDKGSVAPAAEEVETSNSYINNLPDTVVEFIGLNEIKENAKNMIIEKIVAFAVKLLAIVIVYIAVRIILVVVVVVLDIVAKLPVLKQFNEVLGLAVGIVLGLIRVYIILTIVTLISSLPVAAGLVNIINNSVITSYLYNNNFILKMLF